VQYIAPKRRWNSTELDPQDRTPQDKRNFETIPSDSSLLSRDMSELLPFSTAILIMEAENVSETFVFFNMSSEKISVHTYIRRESFRSQVLTWFE
jgi:hypothetical protein